jgi:deoxyribose-phosphate aldolase
MITSTELAAALESALLRPDATRQDVEQHCELARKHGLYGVCVQGARVALACHCLEATPLKIATVAGFPLGATDSDVKRFETEAAVDSGAHEIGVVLNLGWLKDGQDKAVLRELRDIAEAAQEHSVKAILETSLLSEDEIKRACNLIRESGVEFVQITTGQGGQIATAAEVRLIRNWVGPEFGVLASGGFTDLATANALLEAGADRLSSSLSREFFQQTFAD